MYASKLLNLTHFITLELTIRGLTGHGSPRIHKIPICLSWSRESQIACCPCPRFWTWSWIYSCGMWCRWAYWLDNAVKTNTFSILHKPQIHFLCMLVFIIAMTITMIHASLCILQLCAWSWGQDCGLSSDLHNVWIWRCSKWSTCY